MRNKMVMAAAMLLALALSTSFQAASQPPSVLQHSESGKAPELSGIAHVAIRVRDLPASTAFYEKLGFVRAFELSREGAVYEAFIKINDRQFIELYSASAKESQIGFLHLCFQGADLNAIHNDYIAEGLTPISVRKAGAGNLLFTLPGPAQPAFPQNLEYTQYMPGSLHTKDAGQHLGPNRIGDRLISVSLAMVDPTAARTFYIERLHFIPILGTPLLALPGTSGETVAIVPGDLGLRASFTLYSSDLKRAGDRLQQQAIPSTRSGHKLQLSDPDGNLIELTDRKLPTE